MDERIRAVLFDAVGTLIRPVPDVHEVYATFGRRFGSRHDAASIKTRFRQAFANHDSQGETNEQRERTRWRNIVSQVFDDVPDADESLFSELWDHFAEPVHWRLYEDVLPIWDFLRQRNMLVAIASNFDARLEAICRGVHPLDEVDQVFCSSLVGFSKPRPEFFAHVRRELGLEANELLKVGDSLENDIEGARAAGWQAIWIHRGVAAVDASCITQLTELSALIGGVKGP
jgi:putative hydrolase of the HAD superfamily